MLLKETIKTTLRGWARNPLNTAISFISFTIGITSTLILLIFIMDEYRVATSLNHLNDVYMAERKSLFNDSRVNHVNPREFPELQETYPEVELTTRIFSSDLDLLDNEENPKMEGGRNWIEGNFQADSTFAEMFQPVVLAGDLKKTLSSPDEMAVTLSFSKKVYGDESPLGKSIFYKRQTKGTDGKTVTDDHMLTITSLIDDSRKSVFNYNSLTAMDEKRFASGSYSGNYSGYMKLRSGADYKELIKKWEKERESYDKQEKKGGKFYAPESLIPIGDVYFSGAGKTEELRRQDKNLVNIAVILSVIITVIACFNYVNLTMTRASGRLKMMAAQRILGATKWNVRLDIITETFLQIVICFVVSLYLASISVPVFNTFMGTELELRDILVPGNMAAVLLMITIITLVPSAYILFKLERSSSLSLQKSAAAGKTQLVKGLVIAQFTMSVALIAMSFNIHRQINFISHSRPHAENTIIVENVENVISELRDRVKLLPYVTGFSTTPPRPENMVNNGGKNSSFIYPDSNYFKVYETEFIAGGPYENFNDEKQVIVNETFYNKYLRNDSIPVNIGDSIGHSLFPGRVEDKYKLIGITKDIITSNFKTTIQPVAFILQSQRIRYMYNFVIRIQYMNFNENLDDLLTIIREYEDITPDINTMADVYRDMHQDEIRFSKIVKFFTWMSIALTVMGLFGLAWYSVERRRKEIALRKIHGATVNEIILMLCTGFARWIVIAVVIGIPIAYLATREWLNTFVYKTGMSVWVYVATIGIVFIIGIGTVLFQSYRAAVANPVKSIKAE